LNFPAQGDMGCWEGLHAVGLACSSRAPMA
jgi:hypothetical protein